MNRATRLYRVTRTNIVTRVVVVSASKIVEYNLFM